MEDTYYRTPSLARMVAVQIQQKNPEVRRKLLPTSLEVNSSQVRSLPAAMELEASTSKNPLMELGDRLRKVPPAAKQLVRLLQIDQMDLTFFSIASIKL